MTKYWLHSFGKVRLTWFGGNLTFFVGKTMFLVVKVSKNDVKVVSLINYYVKLFL